MIINKESNVKSVKAFTDHAFFLKIKKQNAKVIVWQKYQNFEIFLHHTTFYK